MSAMHRMKLFVVVLAVTLVATACGGGDEVSASTCGEVIDETVQLFQRFIDDIDAEFADLGIEDFVERADDLESFSQLTDDAAAIGELSEELGCSDAEMAAGVASRVGTLTSETTVGRFVIDALLVGGL
jgi:hypothetical protein